MFDTSKDIVLFDPYEILAVTKFFAEGFLILSGDRKILATDMRYYAPIRDALIPKGYTVIPESGLEILAKQLFEMGKSEIYANFSYVSVSVYNELKKQGVTLIDGTSLIQDMLSIKSHSDIENIKKSCQICEKSFEQLMPYIKEGVTELELSAHLEYLFKKNGASGTSFETIVAFGKNSAVPHHKTGNTKLKVGDVVLIDCGCVYAGFMSDYTRTLAYKVATDKFKQIYECVKKAHYKAVNGIKAGMGLKDCDQLSRGELSKYDLDKYFTHSLGHGIGTHIHESPNLSPRSNGIMRDGMVFSVEPGVYLDGEFGIRIEDTVVCLGGQAQSLMQSSKELLIID